MKALTEQAEPFEEALLGDLALEDQLLDRARYIKALAVAAQLSDIENLASRLIIAHSATVEWLTTVLAEDALGGPAALRRTPLQAAAGSGRETGQLAALLDNPRVRPGAGGVFAAFGPPSTRWSAAVRTPAMSP